MEIKIDNRDLTVGDTFKMSEGEGVLFVEREGEKEKEFEATGEKTVSQKATGIVRIFNEYSASQPLVKGTRLLSKEGKLFRTTRYVNIPAKKYVDVEVVAAEAGEEYNIGPTTFSLPGLVGTKRYTFVYGRSYSAMKGGRTENVKIVSREDIDRAKKEMQRFIQESVKEELQQEFGKHFVIPEQGVWLYDVKVSVLTQEGKEQERFKARGEFRSSTILLDPRLIKEKALALLEENKPEEAEIDSKNMSWFTRIEELNTEKREILVLIRATAPLLPRVKATDLTSLTLPILERELQKKELIKEVRVRIFPFWRNNLPSDPDRIEVRIVK